MYDTPILKRAWEKEKKNMNKSSKNIERFENLVKLINRQGVDELMSYIIDSDFYTAPASTTHHGSFAGGLLEHSLNVCSCLMAKKDQPIWKKAFENISEENIIVTALFHDICKTDYYIEDTKNVKIDGIWTQQPFYKVKDNMPLGHGETSVMILQKYIKLETPEMYAIRRHMGSYEQSELWGTLGNAYNRCPFVLATHQADMEATYLLEND